MILRINSNFDFSHYIKDFLKKDKSIYVIINQSISYALVTPLEVSNANFIYKETTKEKKKKKNEERAFKKWREKIIGE